MRTEEAPGRLTFAQLEAQVAALPEGPGAVYKSPLWMRRMNLLGAGGMVAGLLPSVLVHFIEPQMWMLWVVRIGLAFVAIGLLPEIVRSVFVLSVEFRNHRRKFVEQFDHDVDQFRALAGRLADHSMETLDDMERYARMGHERLDSRLGQLVGGLGRIGILPIVLSMIVLLRDWESYLDTPLWLAMLALMAPILWFIGWVGNEFRRRLQLYEFLLSEAKRMKTVRG